MEAEAEALFPITASLTPCQAPLVHPEPIRTYDLIPHAPLLPLLKLGRVDMLAGRCIEPYLSTACTHRRRSSLRDPSLRYSSDLRRSASSRLRSSDRPPRRLSSDLDPPLETTTGWCNGRFNGFSALSAIFLARAAACLSHKSMDLLQMSSICSYRRSISVSLL